MLLQHNASLGDQKPRPDNSRKGGAQPIHLVYRPFIDGLRAIAVTSVVGGHIGLPGFVGGFIGVDIFFVISGYLIIGQILHGLNAGTFSFAKFWSKRALRILPPMLAMLVTSCVIAPFVFVTPAQFREFGNEVIYSATMLVNFYFLFKQNYFDTAATTKPLLHMWSLAVEEQFYIVTPVILFSFWNLSRTGEPIKRWLFPALIILTFLASVISCIIYTQSDKNIAFYVMLCRAWEFIAGGVIWYLLPIAARLPKSTMDVLAAIGLAAIAISVVFFDESRLFPSYLAMLPVAGAFAVLISGAVEPGAKIIRLLAVPPLVWIGLVSYGWYLWHWPLLSFTRIYNFGTVSLPRDILAVSIGLLLAVASYFLVERPCFRLRKLKMQPYLIRNVFAGAFASSAAIAVAGVAYIKVVSTNVESSLPVEMRAEKNTKVMANDPCWMSDPDVLSQDCIEKVAGKKVVLLIGDSHARMLYPALKLRSARNDMEVIALWRSGCAPFAIKVGKKINGDIAKCDEYAERGLATLRQKLKSPPAMAVLGGYWSKGMFGQTYSDFIRRGTIGNSSDVKRGSEYLADALVKLLGTLNEMGVDQTLVVGPSAEFNYFPLDCALRADKLGIGRNFCEVSKPDMKTWLEPVMTELKKAIGSSRKTVLIDTFNVFCNQLSCSPIDREVLLYADTHHVSEAGSEKIFNSTNLRTIFGPKATGNDTR
jgi:peptidoglycan/LPS O-acetylase OafA/YrhL